MRLCVSESELTTSAFVVPCECAFGHGGRDVTRPRIAVDVSTGSRIFATVMSISVLSGASLRANAGCVPLTGRKCKTHAHVPLSSASNGTYRISARSYSSDPF